MACQAFYWLSRLADSGVNPFPVPANLDTLPQNESKFDVVNLLKINLKTKIIFNDYN